MGGLNDHISCSELTNTDKEQYWDSTRTHNGHECKQKTIYTTHNVSNIYIMFMFKYVSWLYRGLSKPEILSTLGQKGTYPNRAYSSLVLHPLCTCVTLPIAWNMTFSAQLFVFFLREAQTKWSHSPSLCFGQAATWHSREQYWATLHLLQTINVARSFILRQW